jgi:hypothetical protein
MVLQINGVYQVAATASGVDQAGRPVKVDLTAYVTDAGDAGIAVSVVEAEVLNEAVIPDGKGGFTKPTLVTATSVEVSPVLPAALLIYRHKGPGADEKFPVTNIYGIQVYASGFEGANTTISVYPLNAALSASIAVAKSDVLKMPILVDPETGQMITPSNVAVISATPVPDAPLSAPILIVLVVVPNWPDAETVVLGGGGLPSAGALGLKTNYVVVPNNGSHDDGDVIRLSPPAGSSVPVGTLVTVTIWGRSE